MARFEFCPAAYRHFLTSRHVLPQARGSLAFFYPNGEPLLERNALLWGPGGFYGGRVTGFPMEATVEGPVARFQRIDEGGSVQRLLDRLVAAQAGDVGTMCLVAEAYDLGRGVAQHLGEAAQLYRAAAERNVLAARFSLGEMYRDGRGVPQDAELARAWLERAVNQGFVPATDALACRGR